MALAQIGSYMTDEEIAALDSYAASIEVTRAALCSLIVQREMREPRLRRRLGGEPPEGRAEGRRRVTVHLRNEALKAAFVGHVRTLGLGSDEAAGRLFRMELEDRWIFDRFGFVGNRT